MMNYVGSISILDRGDAPAQAIIDKNARSLAQRVADETRDELEKVMTRVDNIYESYEASTQALMETQSTLEYVEDIAELEALIKDQIKKKKYQQQVTIFIVGYENVCGQKLRLLQQVNEFFMDNSKSYEEEDWYPKTPDIDLDDCSSKIEESLTTAKELTEKISTINADMVEWLTTYAINKASTKALNMVDSKSKKKLESALSKAKDDVKAITDQLKSALLANDEKDDLIQTYLKQLEGKTLEAQKFKAAAEVAKKNVQGLEAKELVYQEELEKRTSAMKQLQEDLRKMQMDASQSKFLSELNSNRLKNKDSETAEYEALQEVKLDELQSVIERHRLELQESKRELEVLHQDQLKALHETHAADLEALRGEYADMIKKLQGSAGDSRPTTEIESQPPEAEDDGVSRDSSRQESRPSTKDTRSSKGAPTKVTVTRTTPAAKTATKPSKPESKSPVKPVKETADASIQDEGGDPVSAHAETRQSKRARSTLETVKETDHGAEFEDSYDLADENSWALVPVETIPGRFAQYRKMTIRKLSELEEQLGLTVAKTQRKVTTLKSQFQEHKSKWETERKVLIEQVEQAQKLQTEAEKEADVAMTQLEEFINEQERLEEEEEVKRQEVVKGVSKPVMVSIPTQNDDDESEVVTSSSPKTLTPIQPGAETGAPPPTFVQSEESEHELTNLMQQTDDAKYERQRSDSKAISRRSSSINSDVAPWLLASEKKSLDNDDEDDEETVVRSSASKTSFRTKSEHIASEMSKLEEPDEADEDEENDETDSKLVTDEDKQGTVLSKNSSQERRSVASKRSRKTLSRHTTREETQEVLNSREVTPDGDIHVESDQDGQESRSSKIPSQEESERSTSKVTQEKQRSKSKMSATQEESQRSPSQAEETEELEEELVSQSGSHNRSRRGSRQSRSQTRSNMKRRSSLKSVERNESQKSLERNESQKSKISESGTTSRKSTQSRAASRKSNESGVVSQKSEQSGGTPRKSEHEEVHNSLRTSDSDLEEETESVVEDGKLESRKSNSDVLSLRSTQLSKHLTVEEIGHAAEDSVLTERSHGDVELYSEETEYEPIFDVQVVTQEKSDSRRTASQQRMSVSNSLEPSSRSGTQPDPSSSPRSSSQVQVMNARKSSGALSAPPAVEPESETRDKTQTQIVPKTEEEIRATSALSRASLRQEYRNKLGEVRAAVEDRRTKSPAISIPSQRSLEEDQLIDEDDDDEIPYNDIEDLKREQTMEMGTSPPPGQKSSSKLSPVNADHPIVTEYLRLYEGVVQFRNALSKLMVDRDMLQPSQILEDIDTKKFISSSKLEPQIEGMTHNVYHVFEEILAVLSNILLADREPMVSSLTGGGMMMSRDTTQAVVGPKSAESGRGPTVTRASHHSQFSAKSDVSDRIALRELQEQYDRLQHQLTSDTRKHEEQLRHNTVVMMEMQDTINDLQRELSNLGRSSSRLRPQSDTTSPHGTTDSAIMFTRLDSERNAKIMKRAVNDQKMNTEKYKDALVKMEDYVGLPAQRFAHLVRKYVHHSRMKEIEENVKKSKSLNENVFEILDKMEALQNERAKTWADKMDQMGSERIRLANLLMETLDSIEQESGIFLIKPMYSYRGRDIKDARYGGKLTRPIRPQRNLSPNRENLTSFAPAPTPASNMRMIRGQPVPTTQSMTHETTVPKQEVPRPLEGDEGGISGASLNWVGTTQKQTWSMNSSVVRGDPENFLSSQNPNAMNTPRILELDINRMLIGQNTISSKMTQPGMTEDRLVNASQNNLRSYITVNRPTALPGNARPRSFASSATKEFVPPSSPVSQNTKRVRLSDGDMSRNMTNTPPLPPIGSASTRDIPGEPPRSPPGSSMRQSPPHVQEVISPLK